MCHLTPDGRTLLTGGTHGGPDAAVPPDSPTLFTQIWDVATLKEIARANWRLGTPAFSPDSRVVAAWGRDITRWGVATGAVAGSTRGPQESSGFATRVGMAFTGPDAIVAVAHLNQSAYAWGGVSGRALTPPLRGHTRPITALAFAAGGKEVVSGAPDEVCRWDAATGAPRDRTLQRPDSGRSPVAFSADGSRGYVAGRVVDLATKRPVGPPVARSLGGYPTPHFLTPSGSRLALLARDEKDHRVVRCRVLDVASGRVIVEVPLPTDPRLAHVRLRPDGNRLVIASSSPSPAGGSFRLLLQSWGAETGAGLGELAAPAAELLAGFVLADDAHALLGTGLGKLTVIDLASGREVRSIVDADRLACHALALSPDGKRVAALPTAKSTGDRYLRVYDLATGAVRATLGRGKLLDRRDASASDLWVTSLLAFSPDGRRLASSEGESTALVWDVPSAE